MRLLWICALLRLIEPVFTSRPQEFAVFPRGQFLHLDDAELDAVPDKLRLAPAAADEGAGAPAEDASLLSAQSLTGSKVDASVANVGQAARLINPVQSWPSLVTPAPESVAARSNAAVEELSRSTKPNTIETPPMPPNQLNSAPAVPSALTLPVSHSNGNDTHSPATQSTGGQVETLPAEGHFNISSNSTQVQPPEQLAPGLTRPEVSATLGQQHLRDSAYTMQQAANSESSVKGSLPTSQGQQREQLPQHLQALSPNEQPSADKGISQVQPFEQPQLTMTTSSWTTFDDAATLTTSTAATISTTSTSVESDHEKEDEDVGTVSEMFKALQTKSMIKEVCDRLDAALPFLTKEIERHEDESRMVCSVPVRSESCFSRHPLWQCDSVNDTCECSWNPICHGVAAVLEPAFDWPLLCGPGSGGCRCAGFQTCPDSGAAWDCTSKAMDKYQEQRISRLLSHRSEALQKVLKQGVCECYPRHEVWVPLSVGEEKAFMGHPLQELVANLPAESTGLAGHGIISKKVNYDQDGRQRIVVSIGDTAHRSDVGDLEQIPSSKGDEVEHCVITGGRLKLSFRHLFVFAVMLLPLLIVAAFAAQVRWRTARGTALFRGGASSAGEGEVQQSSTAPDIDRRPPTALLFFELFLVFILHVNATVIMTTAHVVVDHISQAKAPMTTDEERLGDATSGVVIGVEPFAGMFGVVLVARFLILRPKETYLSCCGLTILGNLLFVAGLRAESIELLIGSRAVSGLALGATYSGQVYLSRLSSPNMRSEVFGYWELGVGVGLITGPALPSILHLLGVGNAIVVSEAAVTLVAVIAVALLAACHCCFPSDDELQVDQLQRVDLPPWEVDRDMTDGKWVALVVTVTGTCVRVVMRLLWESAAVLILASHFCLGWGSSGYGTSFVVCVHIVAQALITQICRTWSDHRYIQGCEFAQMAGLLMMVRLPKQAMEIYEQDVLGVQGALIHVATFLAGSALFYAGNCLTSAPMAAWGTKDGPRASCILFYTQVGVKGAICLGSWLARLLASEDPHPNTLIAVLLPLVLVQWILNELGPSYSAKGKG